MTQHPNVSRPETAAGQAGALVIANPRSLPSFADIFGNRNPVEIEIGCGKAKFLIARAAENPQINFFGIDVVWKWMKYAVERTEKRRLRNLKFLKADARETVRYGIPPESVSIFHIYFPDPWPKRRHKKRRLVTGEFLKELHARLRENGLVELATDHEDYYHQMLNAVIHSGISWSSTRRAEGERLFEALAKTNYEIKYEAAGKTLYYLELEK
ncbi:MAG: tRNA (guanosine(46)-N7)-methyltransferase TrmB [Candidatus Latescibacterota bacterium]|nr:MAG: tRNA (guanosine(46)-N7)-methyltransferase TrmB [Candidatus Latescibacterota bacterium]